MRIQHNIMAMNSYRNYSNNVSALSKNLEKLSSGYKINRAGDDAAGLAISEKMRAQITGLQQAQANAKSGINLVQTAEGALQEVHDMLNRMVKLADQSANGTYNNETDRAQLQKEVQQLKSEIDRIADSSNFNGMNLLDGSMSDGGLKAIETTGLTTTATPGTASSTVAENAVLDDHLDEGSTLNISMASDTGLSYNISLTRKGNSLIDNNTGKSYTISATFTAAEYDAAIKGAIDAATGGTFTASVADGVITMKSDATGAGAPKITAMAANTVASDGTSTAVDLGDIDVTDPVAEKVNVTSPTALTAATASTNAQSAIFSINGQKFALAATDGDLDAVKSAVGDSVKVLVGANLGAVAGQLAQETGLTIEADNANIKISTGSGKALTLQIGDTSALYNKLKVSIKDMHVNSLGISGVDISTQDGAAAAIDAIKNAINTVSDVRGTLGATQNRLDHTINNLSVMTENIQDAESTIRDTDVADEMMAYTKNNILIQSAQAMLAQANQVPQGVLQLLQ